MNKYNGHIFKNISFGPNTNGMFDRFLCKNCNVIVYCDGDYIFISAYSTILKELHCKELKLSCNEIMIKSVIE